MPNAATADSGKTTKSLIDKLNAALASGADERRRILEHVADLFAAGARGHSSEQGRLVRRHVAGALHRYRSEDARQIGAAAFHDRQPPARLIRSLAFDDGIAVAQPLLAHSLKLSDADLIENASTKSDDHLMPSRAFGSASASPTF